MRSSAGSFIKMMDTWLATVRGLMNSDRAITELPSPRARRARQYLVYCPLPGSDGFAHLAMGMATPFTAK